MANIKEGIGKHKRREWQILEEGVANIKGGSSKKRKAPEESFDAGATGRCDGCVLHCQDIGAVRGV